MSGIVYLALVRRDLRSPDSTDFERTLAMDYDAVHDVAAATNPSASADVAETGGDTQSMSRQTRPAAFLRLRLNLQPVSIQKGELLPCRPSQ